MLFKQFVREVDRPSVLVSQYDRYGNVRPEFRDLPNVGHHLFGPPLKMHLHQSTWTFKDLATVSSAPRDEVMHGYGSA